MAQTGPRDKATIEALKERMARDPLSRAFLQLAEEYRKAGRFEEAVQVCNEGLVRHPGYHTARIALGRTYLDAGDLESAHQALIEVLDSMPENHLAAKLLAEVQVRLGNHAGAAETYRSILSHYPGDREVEGLLNELGDGAGTPPATPEVPAPATGEGFPGVTAPFRPDETADPLDLLEPSRKEKRSTEKAAPAIGPPKATPGTEPLPIPAPPAPVETRAAIGPATADALQTNTLAELYLRQGLVERAIEVYRAMLQVDPGNEQAGLRLRELSAGEEEDGAGSVAAPPTGASPTEHDAAAKPGGAAGAEVEPAAGPAQPRMRAFDDPSGASHSDDACDAAAPAGAGEPRPHATATIERLERWLASIRSGSMQAGEGARR